jgi:Family of unknown function (DUF6275)
MPGPEEVVKGKLNQKFEIDPAERERFVNYEKDIQPFASLRTLGAPQSTIFAGPHQSRAMRIVSDYIKGQLEKTDPVPEFDIYIVWFCFTLGNWKALISTTLPDGMYYEVTYDKAMRRAYLDVYKKFHNQMIPD